MSHELAGLTEERNKLQDADAKHLSLLNSTVQKHEELMARYKVVCVGETESARKQSNERARERERERESEGERERERERRRERKRKREREREREGARKK